MGRTRWTAAVIAACTAVVSAGLLATAPAGAFTIPPSPAAQYGIQESTYVDQTSLSEQNGQLYAPVAAIDSSGQPLPNSAAIVAALHAADGVTVTFATPTIVDFGHYVAGFYRRAGATADPVSAFPDFFRDQNPGSPGQTTVKDGDWYVARYVQLPSGVPIDLVGFQFNSDFASATPATMEVPNGQMPGAFLASDDQLTRIWYSAASTMQLSMMTTTSGSPYELFDGPERDRTLWLWYDASANNTAYYAFGSLALPVAQASYKAANTAPGTFVVSSLPLPDQNGFTERDLAALYQVYADPTILSSYYAQLLAHENSVVQAELDPRGLYRTNVLPVPPNPMNPAKLNDDSMAIEMWDYAGLVGTADLATAMGDPANALAFQERAAALKLAVNQWLWDPAKGVFDDFYGSSHVDEAGNAMAVMYGLATGQQATQILDYLHSHNDRIVDHTLDSSGNWVTSDPPTWSSAENPAGSTDFDRPFLSTDSDYTVSDWGPPYSPLWGAPWGMGSDPNDFSKQYNYNYSLWPTAEAFEVQADFTADNDAAALDLARRAWGTMVSQGPSTFYEGARYDGVPAYRLGIEHGSVDHRWASGIGALLQEYVLGVRPATPGFKTWVVDPHGGDLTWSQGRIPTPAGPLSAWWQYQGGVQNPSGYTMVVNAPSGTSGQADVPVSSTGTLTVDGVPSWRDGQPVPGGSPTTVDSQRNRLVVSALSEGTHVIQWTANVPVGVPEAGAVGVLIPTSALVALAVFGRRRRRGARQD